MKTDKFVWEQLSAFSSLVPVSIGFYYFKKLNAGRRRILYFFILTAYVELSDVWMASHKINNAWQSNVYMLLEYSFFIIVLNSWIKRRASLLLCITGSALFYIIWFASVLSRNGINTYATSASVTEDIIIILWSVYLVGTFSIYTENAMFKNYKPWFAGTTFIYFSVNSLFDYVLSLMVKYSSVYKPWMWDVHGAFQIIMYISFAYVFCLNEG